ncbi:NAD-dependent epimerase/dehydratase family protein [Lichenifustis flavocetrariae]|uniref:NAD-dependent epimerase/dehydratase family protein n=1 Tax=Lichenifustis flavocetrariae TaxID=2949735 RepID=A0AA42CL66_9HYPH|nr:NAD-dependent epimerase/dehydratase family protein [Lichenifustis flavocetrariae]MCW6506995.1 NAD-dependent epimerase/dehydratase family protein [Lichenifustis flavocetrariae]
MIAVTGATGFVGRALCDLLDAKRIEHRQIGRRPQPGIFGIGEIGPETNWRNALGGARVVIHLAARVHQMQDATVDPLAAHRHTNVDGTLALARQAQANGVKRLIFMSSIKVNGEQTEPGRPFRPGDVPVPLDPYGRSKFEAEVGLRELANRTGMEVVIIRPPLVYGAGVAANFRALLSLVARGVPLPLGAVRNKRSLIAVGNLADLIRRCIEHPAAPGGVLMASDGVDLSTPGLLRALGRSLDRPVRLVPVPVWSLRAAAILVRQQAAIQRLTGSLQVDIGDTRRRLDWVPPFSPDAAFAQAAAKGWFS